jgi:hypothetical protein
MIDFIIIIIGVIMIARQPMSEQPHTSSPQVNNARRYERMGSLTYEVIVSQYQHAALGMKFHHWIRTHMMNTGPLMLAPVQRGVTHMAAAPDLGIYIIGVTESFASITARILRDLKNGSQVIWVVSPDEEAVIVYSRKGMRLLGMNDMLDGGDALPGFAISVRDIIGG